MRKLEWRDVDLAGKVVRLRPEISKNKDGRLLPIEGELLEIIERAKQKQLLTCPNVFHEGGRPIGSFRKAWKTACKAAGLGGIHSVRIPLKSPPIAKQTGTHCGANRQSEKSERSDAGNLFIA